jgi:hypothetical protein
MMVLRALLGLFVRPSLDVDPVHAPVALAPGQTPVHVVARGTGMLRIESAGVVRRRFVAGGVDELVFVDVAAGGAAPTIRFRGRVVALPLVAVVAPVDAAPLVAVVRPPPLPPLVVAGPAVRPLVPRFVIPLPALPPKDTP